MELGTFNPFLNAQARLVDITDSFRIVYTREQLEQILPRLVDPRTTTDDIKAVLDKYIG